MQLMDCLKLATLFRLCLLSFTENHCEFYKSAGINILGGKMCVKEREREKEWKEKVNLRDGTEWILDVAARKTLLELFCSLWPNDFRLFPTFVAGGLSLPLLPILQPPMPPTAVWLNASCCWNELLTWSNSSSKSFRWINASFDGEVLLP